jgi:hypothetical protein
MYFCSTLVCERQSVSREREMTKKSVNLHFSLVDIRRLAEWGIENALLYSTISESAKYSYDRFKTHKVESDTIIADHVPATSNNEDQFHLHLNRYKLWTLSNCVNEIIEVFYSSLELCVCAIKIPELESFGEVIISSQEDLDAEILKLRKKYQRFMEIKKIFDEVGITIKKDHLACIESFNDIRNILTHNQGIYDGRLAKKGNPEVLKWKYLHPFFKTQDDKEHSADELSPLGASLCVRLKTRELELKKKEPIHFTHLDVKEIGLTFKLIIEEIAKDVAGYIRENYIKKT